ncbi:MAG: hypothetical protein QG656_1665 [Candidatus Hydrogenedentes bacterium]|nr:hypothetical protein [Candidatus Hydrogenedentota bacterium]
MGIWQKLAPRERMLAGIILFLLAVGVAGLSAQRALLGIGDLNRAIQQREDTLVNYTKQLAKGKSVDRAYARVAAQHSSVWSEAEIHDKLGQEIYRLSLKNLPAPGAEPESPNRTNTLVSIPSLGQGRLKGGGEGYREYELSFNIPEARIEDLTTFIERLQSSNQSLRVDSVLLYRTRDHVVSAQIGVTRTIVDRTPDMIVAETEPATAAAPGATAAPAAPDTDSWRSLPVDPASWQADGCDLTASDEHKTRNPQSLAAAATKPGASFYLSQSVDSGAEYELSLDITATGPARILVLDGPSGAPYEGSQDVAGDGETRQYRLRFTTPSQSEDKTPLRVPALEISDAGTKVFVDNVLLRRVAG